MYERRYIVDGVERRFFTIGAVAEAVNRSPETVRRWERLGVIPPPNQCRQSVVPEGRRRLYTDAEVRALGEARRRCEYALRDARPLDIERFSRLAHEAMTSE